MVRIQVGLFVNLATVISHNLTIHNSQTHEQNFEYGKFGYQDQTRMTDERKRHTHQSTTPVILAGQNDSFKNRAATRAREASWSSPR